MADSTFLRRLFGCGPRYFLPDLCEAKPLPRPAEKTVVVDAHCHIFNSNDVPTAGFIEHYLMGQFDLPAELVCGLLRGPIENLQQSAQASATGAGELQALLKLLEQPGPVAAPSRRAHRRTHEEFANDLTIGSHPGRSASLQAWTDLDRQLRPHRRQIERGVAIMRRAHPQARPSIPAMEATHPHLTLLTRLISHVPFIHTGFLSRLEIAHSLLADNEVAQVLCPLLVDFDYWTQLTLRQPPPNQSPAPVTPGQQIPIMSALSKLSFQGKLSASGQLLLPFVAFNPWRDAVAPDAFRELGPFNLGYNPEALRALPPLPAGGDSPSLGADVSSFDVVRAAILHGGFVGVKIYPPCGFAPIGNAQLPHLGDRGALIDMALHRLYGWCEANQVPITAHAGSGNSFEPEMGALAMPCNWRPVLEQYPSLRLNLGHFGHDARFPGTPPCGAPSLWYQQALALIDSFEHVHADLADTNQPMEPPYLAMLKDAFGASLLHRRRIMYGSDWFMDDWIIDRPSDFLPSMRDAMARLLGHDHPDFMDRFMGLNALRFLGFINDVGAPDLGNLNRRRLLAFLGSQGLKPSMPWWLQETREGYLSPTGHAPRA